MMTKKVVSNSGNNRVHPSKNPGYAYAGERGLGCVNPLN